MKRALIWITGAAGQLGFALRAYLRVTHYAWDTRFFSHSDFDLTQVESMYSWFQREIPSCIINCAAYTNVDQAESEAEVAYAVNAIGVRDLARLCEKYHVPLIHLSTDYVFSGCENRPYLESSQRSPRSIYGASKAAGECFLELCHAQYIILRTSWLFGASENFVTKILSQGLNRKVLPVVQDQIGSPTAADELASVLCQIVERILLGTACYGIYHYRNTEIESWATFATHILEIAASFSTDYCSISIQSVSSDAYPTVAVRPRYSVLSTEKIVRDYGVTLCSYRGGLQRVVKDFIHTHHTQKMYAS